MVMAVCGNSSIVGNVMIYRLCGYIMLVMLVMGNVANTGNVGNVG